MTAHLCSAEHAASQCGFPEGATLYLATRTQDQVRFRRFRPLELDKHFAERFDPGAFSICRRANLAAAAYDGSFDIGDPGLDLIRAKARENLKALRNRKQAESKAQASLAC